MNNKGECNKKKKKKRSHSGDSKIVKKHKGSKNDVKEMILPISAFLEDKPKLIDEMFKIVSFDKIKKMLPPVMSDCSLEELKEACLVELLGMSNKRIRSVLKGKEMSSSSESEDIDNMEISDDDSDVKFKEKTGCTQEGKSNEDMENADLDTLDIGVSEKEMGDLEEFVPPPHDEHRVLKRHLSPNLRQKSKKHLMSVSNERSKEHSSSSDSDGSQRESTKTLGKSSLDTEEYEEVDEKKSMTLLDILELEMRARAIRALLRKEQEPQVSIPTVEDQNSPSSVSTESEISENVPSVHEASQTISNVKKEKDTEKLENQVIPNCVSSSSQSSEERRKIKLENSEPSSSKGSLETPKPLQESGKKLKCKCLSEQGGKPKAEEVNGISSSEKKLFSAKRSNIVPEKQVPETELELEEGEIDTEDEISKDKKRCSKDNDIILVKEVKDDLLCLERTKKGSKVEVESKKVKLTAANKTSGEESSHKESVQIEECDDDVVFVEEKLDVKEIEGCDSPSESPIQDESEEGTFSLIESGSDSIDSADSSETANQETEKSITQHCEHDSSSREFCEKKTKKRNPIQSLNSDQQESFSTGLSEKETGKGSSLKTKYASTFDQQESSSTKFCEDEIEIEAPIETECSSTPYHRELSPTGENSHPESWSQRYRQTPGVTSVMQTTKMIRNFKKKMRSEKQSKGAIKKEQKNEPNVEIIGTVSEYNMLYNKSNDSKS